MWLECWDAKKEQIYYFNKLTGKRSIDVPEEFTDQPDGNDDKPGPLTLLVSKDPAVIFRTKRYRLLRAVYKEMGDELAMSGPKGDRGGPQRGRSPRRNVALRDSNKLNIHLRRDHVFEDTFNQFRLLTGQDLCRKSKVHFEGEPGIDSGGLTKDWYLALSKAITAHDTNLFRNIAAGVHVCLCMFA